MRSKSLNLITTTLACLLFFGCKKQTEEFTTAPLSDYYPLQVGKYITYRLDSTVFTNFGTSTEVHSYQEKQLVDAQITDAIGRDSYRVLRYIRDTSGNLPWAPAGTYFVTPTDKTIEVIENNLRFVKLASPVKQGDSWEGNHYLPDAPFSSLYSFNNDQGMGSWDYTYTDTTASLTLNGKTYNDVLTVDVDIPDPIFNANQNTAAVIDPNGYAAVSYMQDNYAKGIGLISQEFIMWDYQPPSVSNSGKRGFGVKRSIIDHN